MCHMEDVMMSLGLMEVALVQYMDLVARTPLEDTANHAVYAHHIDRIRARYSHLLGQYALDELDLRVGLLDAADWANNMMAQLVA